MNPSASALLNRLLARGKFRHVQVLMHLAELGSVQRTADAIGMTQSSVTQMLANLEGLVGVRLFERHARGVRPTPACADLLPVARQLMAGVANSAEVIAAQQRQGQSQVRLIGSAAAIHGLLATELPRFCDRHPEIQVQLREAEGEDQLLAIARGEVDLVACRQPGVIPEGWAFQPVRGDAFVIVARPAHGLARRRVLRQEDLLGATWLTVPAGLAARTRFDELFADAPAAPRCYPVVCQSNVMIVQLLQRRELLALLPRNLMRTHLESGELIELRLALNIRLDPIGILRPRQGERAAGRALADFLQASAGTRDAA